MSSAALLLGVLALAHLWPVPEGTNLLLRTLQNAMHVPAFAVLSAFLALMFAKLRWVRVALICLGIGLLLEASQVLTSREASLRDLASDVLGILLGLLIARSPSGMKLAAGAVLFLVTAWSPFQVWAAYQQRDAMLPVLLDARVLESSLFNSNSQVQRSAGNLLSICLADVSYPGITLEEPPPDWRKYETLEVRFGVENDEDILLTVAVGHVGSTGTSAYVTRRFPAGMHTWEVPVSELQTTGRFISRFNLHSYREHAGQCLVLDSVRFR